MRRRAQILPRDGTVRVVVDGSGETVFSHELRAGDIWRMCATKDAPIRDWVRSGLASAGAGGRLRCGAPLRACAEMRASLGRSQRRLAAIAFAQPRHSHAHC